MSILPNAMKKIYEIEPSNMIDNIPNVCFIQHKKLVYGIVFIKRFMTLLKIHFNALRNCSKMNGFTELMLRHKCNIVA